MEAISCRGVTKSYGGRAAVQDLTMSVSQGVVFGFLGPNGAGKTTTIRCLLGLTRPNSGQVQLLGQKAGSSELAGRVGALVEEPAMYPWLTGRENLQVLAAAGPPVQPQLIDKALDRVRLSGAAGSRVKTYSQGMRQRLGLAAALMREPPLLILDEPTNGLDPVGIREFRGILREAAAAGAAVLLSSHALAEVQQICDQVLILSKGRAVAAGAVTDLLSGKAATRLRVAPDDSARAREVLEPFTFSVDGPGLFTVTAVSPRQVAERLQIANIIPEELSAVQVGLEEHFLTLTGGDTSDAFPRS